VPAPIVRLARTIGVEPPEGRVLAWAATTFFLVHAGTLQPMVSAKLSGQGRHGG